MQNFIIKCPYDDAYLMSKFLASEFNGIRLILMIDKYYILIVDIDNKINILNIYENNFLFKYAWKGGEVVSVIKSYNWNIYNYMIKNKFFKGFVLFLSMPPLKYFQIFFLGIR